MIARLPDNPDGAKKASQRQVFRCSVRGAGAKCKSLDRLSLIILKERILTRDGLGPWRTPLTDIAVW
jgi:hypothetical protein